MEVDYTALNKALAVMMGKVSSVMGTFDAVLQPVFLSVGVIMFVLACLGMYHRKSLEPMAMFVVKYAQLMVLIGVAGHWGDLTSGYVKNMGDFAANAAGFDIMSMTPGHVIVKGLEVANTLYEENVSWWRTLFGSSDDTIANVLLMIACLGTIIMAVFMAAWLIMMFLAFKLGSTVAMLFLPFMMFDATRFMAAPGIARMMAYGVQMLVMSLVCGMFFMTLENLELSERILAGQAISMLVIMFAFAILLFWTHHIAREQISGMPEIDFHGPGKSMGGMIPALGTMGLGALGGFAGARMGSRGGASLPSPGGGVGGSGLPVPAKGASPGGSLPQGPSRLMERGRTMIGPAMSDADWTLSRDLPKSATRLLENNQKRLNPPSTKGE